MKKYTCRFFILSLEFSNRPVDEFVFSSNTEKYNNNIGASFIESYKVIDQIRFYKSKGYLVILISHAGVEFIPTPPPYIKEIYKNFVNEGADLVVGHHPHVPQGFEIYKNAAIFYSIGNFTVWRRNLRKNCYHSF